MTSIAARPAPVPPQGRVLPQIDIGKAVDLRHSSAVSAASDFAFQSADADRSASLSAAEFAALGNKNPDETKTKALFAAIDGDSNGSLTSQEVRASGLLSPENLRSLLGLDELGAWAVAQGDADGDGGLTFEEYTSGRGAGPVSASLTLPGGETQVLQGWRLDAAPAVFNRMDTDADGRLSAGELDGHFTAPEGAGAYAPSAGASRTGPALVAMHDADADAALSEAEIVDAAKAAGADETGGRALINAADSDGDGRVSGDEFAALAADRQSLIDHANAPRNEASAADLLLAKLMRTAFDRLADAFVDRPPPAGELV